MISVSLLMGANESTVNAFAQVPGEALRMPRRALQAEFARRRCVSRSDAPLR
jgi:hypothetical protein